jgi:hypothetical protein
MARRFILSDDLSGNESEDVKNHVYMVDNVFYEVDFSADSFAEFEKALARFIKVSRETRRITATAKGEASKAEVIRQWAKANGMEVAEKGRLSEDIIAAYDAAHSDEAPTDPNTDETDTSESNSDVSEETPNNGDKPVAETPKTAAKTNK